MSKWVDTIYSRALLMWSLWFRLQSQPDYINLTNTVTTNMHCSQGAIRQFDKQKPWCRDHIKPLQLYM